MCIPNKDSNQHSENFPLKDNKVCALTADLTQKGHPACVLTRRLFYTFWKCFLRCFVKDKILGSYIFIIKIKIVVVELTKQHFLQQDQFLGNCGIVTQALFPFFLFLPTKWVNKIAFEQFRILGEFICILYFRIYFLFGIFFTKHLVLKTLTIKKNSLLKILTGGKSKREGTSPYQASEFCMNLNFVISSTDSKKCFAICIQY